MDAPDVSLLKNLTEKQRDAVRSGKRRLLIIAGAGSGKTEVMARRVAWWVAVKEVPKDKIVAFTFTERAAEEMKFRIRSHIEKVTAEGEPVTLGRMYIGTIHGFCLQMLRQLRPDDYHNFDVIDEAARFALVQRGFNDILGLRGLKNALGKSQFDTMWSFLESYDLMNEYGLLDVRLPSGIAPHSLSEEAEWCKKAAIASDVGTGDVPDAFGVSAARYYAYLKCRRFLDFSTSQAEFLRLLKEDKEFLRAVRERVSHLVIDEVQDVNRVQEKIVKMMVGREGHLTAVGDHRQAIYTWRGGKVEIMADLYAELKKDPDGEVVEFQDNFRSTRRIIGIANRWAGTISKVKTMTSPPMSVGRKSRTDFDSTHVAIVRFDERSDEAAWIAKTIQRLVPEPGRGAKHDDNGSFRGISHSDIAVLLRTSTDARTYMQGLEAAGIPAVFKAGPDLFLQPEVLLLLSAMARMAGITEFYGNVKNPSTFPGRVKVALGCDAKSDEIIRAACNALRAAGLPLAPDLENRLLLATDLLQRRFRGDPPAPDSDLKALKSRSLRRYLKGTGAVRRVFPQALYQMLLSEAEVNAWDGFSGRGTTAMFHLGALSTLIKGVETPGWTDPTDLRYQIIALTMWGAKNARTEEAPLLVPPDAVTISTIHGAKGLQWPVVFVADVTMRRFPSQFARRIDEPIFEGQTRGTIDPAELADNPNLDGERRLLYVAMTRAERYLFLSSCNGSDFFKEVTSMVAAEGGSVVSGGAHMLRGPDYLKSEFGKDVRLVTSFTDLSYFLECPHDFYLRKVLGFAPTIDQAFGYGRGVHNLLRAIHSDPKGWAEAAKDPAKLQAKLDDLVERGLFYLRYTTGPPAENMRNHALKIIGDYVRIYAPELAKLTFEPEMSFETLLEEEQTLVGGAIDVIRMDDPPRVTLIDFKSGEAESDAKQKLDEELLRLQVTLYGIAAKKELEYEPERGLLRYLGEADPKKREMSIDFNGEVLGKAWKTVVDAAARIRRREFNVGPTRGPRDKNAGIRCGDCDFLQICGMPKAKETRTGPDGR